MRMQHLSQRPLHEFSPTLNQRIDYLTCLGWVYFVSMKLMIAIIFTRVAGVTIFIIVIVLIIIIIIIIIIVIRLR